MIIDPVTVIKTILSFAAPKAINYAQKQEIVIKILEKLGLNPTQPASDFDTVYACALVKYGVGKSETILNFWREKEIKSKFWQAFNANPSDFTDDAEDFLKKDNLTLEFWQENIDICPEFREFYQEFCSVAKRSRKPGEVVNNPDFKELSEQKPYPDEFKSLIEEKLTAFCGREFVFAEFEKFQKTHSQGYFTVIGDAGMGKSAISAKYVSDNHCPCYFNILTERRNRPEDFLKSIRQQLIQRYGLQGVENANLAELLVKIRENHQQKPLVILVDALDEVEQPDGAENILYLP